MHLRACHMSPCTQKHRLSEELNNRQGKRNTHNMFYNVSILWELLQYKTCGPWWKPETTQSSITANINYGREVHSERNNSATGVMGSGRVNESTFPACLPMLECGFESQSGLEFSDFSMWYYQELYSRIFFRLFSTLFHGPMVSVEKQKKQKCFNFVTKMAAMSLCITWIYSVTRDPHCHVNMCVNHSLSSE